MDDGDEWSSDSDIEKNQYNWTDAPVHRDPHEPRATTPDDLTAIDLFSGPGGISQGLRQAGFESVLGADIHEPSIDTYARNHPHAHTLLGNIKRLTKGEPDDRDILTVLDDPTYDGDDALLKEAADAALDGHDLTLLTGGVPCQGFSIANKKQDDEDERNYLFEEFVRAVKLLDPEFVLIENVSTMQAAKDGAFVDAIHECLNHLGYASEHRVLTASEYGVPQKRRRLFFLAARDTEDITWPDPTTPEEPVTIRDALSDLPALGAGESATAYATEPANEYQRRMRDIPVPGSEAGVVHNHVAPNHPQKTIDRIANCGPGEPMYDAFKQRRRLIPDEPSGTIIAGGIRPTYQFGHYDQPRGLTVRERARIQSFPDQYYFEGGVTQQRVQTGMAVPPLLAQALGEAIRAMKEQ